MTPFYLCEDILGDTYMKDRDRMCTIYVYLLANNGTFGTILNRVQRNLRLEQICFP